MNPIEHISNNHVFKAPEGMKECDDLSVTVGNWSGYPCIVSHWKPSPEELKLLNEGKPVQLTIVGRSMPPVSLMVT